MSARAVSDAALVRRVRWRLLAWSGGSTLAVLILLGTLIYIAVASSLESAAVEQLRQRAAILAPRIEMLATVPPAIAPGARLQPDRLRRSRSAGVSFVGGSSAGTLAFVIGPNDAAFPDVAQVFDAQLPNRPAWTRPARAASRSSSRASTERQSESCRTE